MSVATPNETLAENTSSEALPLSLLLKSTSTGAHEGLDKRIISLAPFSNRERYALFVRTQSRLHQAVSPWFQNEQLNEWLPELKLRDRVAAVLQDCQDLGVSEAALGEDKQAAVAQITDPYTALGWVYTVEGSNLGAAFLLKMARAQLELTETFGARHLAGHDDGRGAHWKRFREDLDALPLSESQRELAAQGAMAAFTFARESVETLMAGNA